MCRQMVFESMNQSIGCRCDDSMLSVDSVGFVIDCYDWKESRWDGRLGGPDLKMSTFDYKLLPGMFFFSGSVSYERLD